MPDRIVEPGFRPSASTQLAIACAGCRQGLVGRVAANEPLPRALDCRCGYRTETVAWRLETPFGMARAVHTTDTTGLESQGGKQLI